MPFFIVVVADVGGLLTPLGDPPLLVGYIQGVPFFWTLRLLPVWLLYVGSLLAAFYAVDKRAYAHESRTALAADRAELEPLALRGRRDLLFLLAVVPAALLPAGFREAALLALAALSYAATRRAVHEANSFGFGPLMMVKAVAESERWVLPSLFRYAFFAFTTMLPAHLIVTAALWWLGR